MSFVSKRVFCRSNSNLICSGRPPTLPGWPFAKEGGLFRLQYWPFARPGGFGAAQLAFQIARIKPYQQIRGIGGLVRGLPAVTLSPSSNGNSTMRADTLALISTLFGGGFRRGVDNFNKFAGLDGFNSNRGRLCINLFFLATKPAKKNRTTKPLTTQIINVFFFTVPPLNKDK